MSRGVVTPFYLALDKIQYKMMTETPSLSNPQHLYFSYYLLFWWRHWRSPYLNDLMSCPKLSRYSLYPKKDKEFWQLISIPWKGQRNVILILKRINFILESSIILKNIKRQGVVFKNDWCITKFKFVSYAEILVWCVRLSTFSYDWEVIFLLAMFAVHVFLKLHFLKVF